MLGMMGTLNLASQAMQAQMAGVEVTGQNLANVNTPGYSRQVVNLVTSPDIQSSVGSEGTGVSVASISQVVSSVLNNQIQAQNSTSNYWTAQQSALQNAQNGLGEFLNGTASASSTSTTPTIATDSGLASQLANFFNSFSALTSSASTSNAQAAISSANTLATSFNNINTQLNAAKTSLNSTLSSNVTSANQLLSQIATLNQQIFTAQASGGTANDLLDSRQQALQNLAKLTNITTATTANGSVNVSVGGQTLVNGFNVADTLQTYDPGNGNLLVQTATGGVNLTLTGGSMQGTIDARDNTLVPLQNSLNTLANTLITQVNGIQNSGYNSSGGTGNTFFTGTDAGSIGVNSALTNNASLLQISASATNGGDTSLAGQIAALATTTQSTLGNQTIGNSYAATVANLGSALQTANNQVTNQAAVSSMLSTQLGSISGVNIDEEMTNMMTFQRAYQASAQVVTTINTLLGTVIAMKTS